MIRWLTPLRGTVPDDITARCQLLATAPSGMLFGFELILLQHDYTQADVIMHNTKNIPYPISSVHVPFPQINGQPAQYDLFTQAGQAKLRATAAIAKQVGAAIVVVHSQVAIPISAWLPEYTTVTWRDKLFEKIFTVLKTVQADYPTVTLCLENMPLPLFADSVNTSTAMLYNPCLITVADMKQAAQAGIQLTFDVCHYDLMRRLWHNWIQRDGDIIPDRIATHGGIVGVYPTGRQPSYAQLWQQLKPAIGHIHLADSSGMWHNNGRLPGGGLPLGTGDIDATELYQWLQPLLADSQHTYTINLEVRDRDMTVLAETAASLTYLHRLLYAN
ncbi:MAG: hypothetical protein HYV33_01155 [Candidatus Kerfeldbacteria bacterium]|nr:hypothetical protein [Candidatus Kerfeldbacteria bacterium]